MKKYGPEPEVIREWIAYLEDKAPTGAERVGLLCIAMMAMEGEFWQRKWPECQKPYPIEERLKIRRRLILLRRHVTEKLSEIQDGLQKEIKALSKEMKA